MNRKSASDSSERLPEHRHAEQQPAGQQDQRDLDVADDDVGHDLAEHDLERADRHREQVLHRAALALAGDRDRGHHHHGHGQDGADQARHDVVFGRAFGVVAAVDAQIERRARRLSAASGPVRSCASAVRFERGERCQRVAGRDRVGGVGLDQDRRPLAAQQLAREVRRNAEHELDLAAREQLGRLGLARRPGG